ncbi:163_t:CDS:2, partial [Acaulospora morrowiae]
DPDFLKSILPLSDELNEVLKDIFNLDPEKRISLEELRERILACHSFTVSEYDTYYKPSSKVVDPYHQQQHVEIDVCEEFTATAPQKHLNRSSTNSSATACSWYSMNSEMDFSIPPSEFLDDYDRCSTSTGSSSSLSTLATSQPDLLKCIDPAIRHHLLPIWVILAEEKLTPRKVLCSDLLFNVPIKKEYRKILSKEAQAPDLYKEAHAEKGEYDDLEAINSEVSFIGKVKGEEDDEKKKKATKQMKFKPNPFHKVLKERERAKRDNQTKTEASFMKMIFTESLS